MYDLGAIYPAALNVFDENGGPVNAQAVTLTFTLPDQSTAAPAVQNPPAVQGQYTYAYVTSQPGRHMVRWTTVNPVTTYTDVFDVAEMAPPSILSLADARQTLGMPADYTDDDAELRFKLMGLTRAVENYKHEAIVPRAVTGERHEFPLFGWAWDQPTIRLTQVPVLQLLSVQSAPPHSPPTVYDVVNNLYTDLDTGLVTVIAGPPFAGPVLCGYTAGYQIIPYNYLEGSRVLLQHLWESRRGPGGADGVVGPEELQDWRHSASFPRKVMEWFGPPRPVVF